MTYPIVIGNSFVVEKMLNQFSLEYLLGSKNREKIMEKSECLKITNKTGLKAFLRIIMV